MTKSTKSAAFASFATFTSFAVAGSLAILIIGLCFTVRSEGEHNEGDRLKLDRPDVTVRFAQEQTGPESESPDFQRHVAPLLGRLGCNARACHGSFQGQGGFQLSLFGYDFEKDLASLLEDSTGRVDVDSPADSLILTKPTDADNHEGGLRYKEGSWQYHLIKKWVEDGASAPATQTLTRLEVVPAELRLTDPNEKVTLQVIAHWSDGTEEDVTPLARFESNNSSIADVTETGVINTSTIAGDSHVVVHYDSAIVPVPVLHPYEGQVDYSDIVAATVIDELALAKLKKLNIRPSEVCDDATFLRRVTLDISGTLPSPRQVTEFLADNSATKRQHTIDHLLETPAYAAWWATFFCDLTGNSEKQLQNTGYVPNVMSKQWYDWIYDRVDENVPYDEIVEGIVLGTSRDDDESFTNYCERMTDSYRNDEVCFGADDSMPYYWMRREFQDADSRAISFAHGFMGIRIQCAQCHKHPFDQWTQDDFQEFSRFFNGVSLTRGRNVSKKDRPEMAKLLSNLGIDPKNSKLNNGQIRRQLAQHLRKGDVVPFPELKTHPPKHLKKPGEKRKKGPRETYKNGKLLGSEPIDLTQYDDVREPVMEWLRRDDNPYFARALVNRVWAHYFGRGIVEPADDLSMANPPSNAELLDHLAKTFVESNYDLKRLHREITNSRTYQRDWEPNQSNVNDDRNFSHALPRRLPAEVIYDAVSQAAASDEQSEEYLTKIAKRAIAIPGTGGRRRPKRQPGKVDPTFALSVFGKSERKSSCDCDRSEEPTLIQTVYLKNDRDIHALLRKNDGWIGDANDSLAGNPLTKKESRRLEFFEKRVTKVKEEQAKKLEDGDEDSARRLGNQLEVMEQRMAPFRARRDAGENPKKTESIPPEKIVEDAYLRTLSRYPTEEEIKRCVAHLKSDDDLFDRTADLLWALVNTKEFIVNH